MAGGWGLEAGSWGLGSGVWGLGYRVVRLRLYMVNQAVQGDTGDCWEAVLSRARLELGLAYSVVAGHESGTNHATDPDASPGHRHRHHPQPYTLAPAP